MNPPARYSQGTCEHDFGEGERNAGAHLAPLAKRPPRRRDAGWGIQTLAREIPAATAVFGAIVESLDHLVHANGSRSGSVMPLPGRSLRAAGETCDYLTSSRRGPVAAAPHLRYSGGEFPMTDPYASERGEPLVVQWTKPRSAYWLLFDGYYLKMHLQQRVTQAWHARSGSSGSKEVFDYTPAKQAVKGGGPIPAG